MREQLRAFFAGLMFLTRVPVPAWVGHDDTLLARSTPYFPLIGALVGGMGAATYVVARHLWAPTVAAVLAVIATVWLTGAFHEDALADAFDGFGGGWGTEKILLIMKDSRIGSYGATALALVLLLRVATLAGMGDALVPRALVAGHVLGRWSSLPLIWHYPYVREQSATSKPFAASVTTERLGIGTALMIGLVVAALGLVAWVPILVAMAVSTLAGRYFRMHIGGITGDCLGAANQVVEVATYLTIAAVYR
jgi:adenosylcobinamide-GDP ribazoletransferase